MGKRLEAALLTVTGIKPVMALLRRDAVTARDMIDQTVSSLDAHRRKTRPAGAERFAQAVRRQGLTEADLESRYLQLCIEAWVFGCLALSVGVLFCYFLITGSWAGTVTGFGLTPAFAAFALRASFRAWQIRERRLGRLHEWLRQPRAWWPRGRMRG